MKHWLFASVMAAIAVHALYEILPPKIVYVTHTEIVQLPSELPPKIPPVVAQPKAKPIKRRPRPVVQPKSEEFRCILCK